MSVGNKDHELPYRLFKELFRELKVFHDPFTAPLLLGMLQETIEKKILTHQAFLQLATGIVPYGVLENAKEYFSSSEEEAYQKQLEKFQSQLNELFLGLRLYFMAVGKKDASFYQNYIDALKILAQENSERLN